MQLLSPSYANNMPSTLVLQWSVPSGHDSCPTFGSGYCRPSCSCPSSTASFFEALDEPLTPLVRFLFEVQWNTVINIADLLSIVALGSNDTIIGTYFNSHYSCPAGLERIYYTKYILPHAAWRVLHLYIVHYRVRAHTDHISKSYTHIRTQDKSTETGFLAQL